MISFFFKLTSSIPVFRKMRGDGSRFDDSDKPLWIQIRDRDIRLTAARVLEKRERLWQERLSSHTRELRHFLDKRPSNPPRQYYFNTQESGCYTIQYRFNDWEPITANRDELHSRIGGRKLTPEEDPGLKDLAPVIPRVKSFRLSDAISYSLRVDIRCSIAVCGMLGFSMWWGIAPEPLLLKPAALTSLDLHTLYTAVKDTFIHNVCATHPAISSPCECGEPLNNEVRRLLEPDTFDPLGLDRPKSRAKALAVYLAAVLITVALTESVSPNGVYLNL